MFKETRPIVLKARHHYLEFGPRKMSSCATKAVLPRPACRITRKDVAQTDGDPLPTIAHDATGDPGIHLAALEQAITDAGVLITRLADLGGAHGYSQPGRITILDSLTPADTAAVLVHEFAHLCSAVAYID